MATFSSRVSMSSGSSMAGGASAISLSSGGGARMRVMRAGSVYGGAGGSGVRISSAARGAGFGLAAGGGAGFGLAAGGGAFESAAGAGKFTLQNLNDRLATYISQVRSLEQANAELELKIRQFLDSKLAPATHDYSSYMVTIGELQAKVTAIISLRGGSLLGIDNAKLAADDFRVKFEAEQSIRLSVEADIAGLRRVLDELALTTTDLNMQMTSIQEEIGYLNRNHQEDLLAARAHAGSKVDVEVDAAPQEDLSLVLAGVREHYEAVAAKNRRELEAWYQAKTEALSREVLSSTTVLQTSSTELATYRSTAQALQIELQGFISMNASLDTSLVETKTRFAAMLSGFQGQVTSLEDQLAALRINLEHQGQEYALLLDIKTRLQLEIAEYNRLLNGDMSAYVASSSLLSASSASLSAAATLVSAPVSTTRTRVVTVTEELVDGKVVSTSTASSLVAE